MSAANYASGHNKFLHFCADHGVVLPLPDAHHFTSVLVTFMYYLLHVGGLSYGTIRNYGWAARDLHARMCGADLTVGVMWSKAIAYHQHYGRHAHAAKQPFQLSWLHAVSALPGTAPLFFAVAVGFTFMLRCSEYLCTSPASPHTILWRDAWLTRDRDGEHLHLVVPSSKTDPSGRGAELQRRAVPGSPFCVVALFKQHQAAHPHAAPDSPLFCDAGGHHLRVGDVITVVKYAALLAGADPARYASHSLRSGGTTSLWLACRDQLVVQREGRWTNLITMLRYCRVPASIAAASTRRMQAMVIPSGIDTYEARRR